MFYMLLWCNMMLIRPLGSFMCIPTMVKYFYLHGLSVLLKDASVTTGIRTHRLLMRYNRVHDFPQTGESKEIQTDVSAQEEQMRRNPRNDKEQVFSQGYTSLESLCVTDTALSSWQHLHDLRLFPRLHSVKIKVKAV